MIRELFRSVAWSVAFIVAAASAVAQTAPATQTGRPAQVVPATPAARPVPAAPTATPVVKTDLDQYVLLKGGDDATSQTIPVTGQSFSHAIQVKVSKAMRFPWDVTVASDSIAPVHERDVLLLSFWMRRQPTAKDGAQIAMVVFERNSDPYDKSLRVEFAPTAQWQKYDFPFTVKRALDAGQAHLAFDMGYGAATVEIAGVSLVNYERKALIRDLPQTHLPYAGMEPDAPWRKAALERIDQIRKGDLTVAVVNSDGKPLDDADVHLKMTRHAFPFGTAVAASLLLANTPNSQQYRDHVLNMFNRVVMENDLKWPEWNNNSQRAITAVKWLRAHGIEVRGHNLVWPAWNYLPDNLEDLKSNPAALRKRIADHITQEVTAMRGLLCEWDVVNEPFANHDVQDVLGPGVLTEWFKLARAADPNVKLFINDYPVPVSDPDLQRHWNAYIKTIGNLIDNWTPFDGIGLQCHMGTKPPTPQELLSGLDEMGKLGKPIEVTEFDFDTEDEQIQADYTRDFLIAMFSHPKVSGIIMWGFWEGSHWRPNAALFRQDWSIKPNGQAWENMVRKLWWTDVTGNTDSSGQFMTRGFAGNYDLTITYHDQTKIVPIVLSTQGAQVIVTMP